MPADRHDLRSCAGPAWASALQAALRSPWARNKRTLPSSPQPPRAPPPDTNQRTYCRRHRRREWPPEVGDEEGQCVSARRCVNCRLAIGDDADAYDWPVLRFVLFGSPNELAFANMLRAKLANVAASCCHIEHQFERESGHGARSMGGAVLRDLFIAQVIWPCDLPTLTGRTPTVGSFAR